MVPTMQSRSFEWSPQTLFHCSAPSIHFSGSHVSLGARSGMSYIEENTISENLSKCYGVVVRRQGVPLV